jgi:hypothetical protein
MILTTLSDLDAPQTQDSELEMGDVQASQPASDGIQ